MGHLVGTHERFKNPAMRRLARLVCRWTHRKHWEGNDFYGRNRQCSKCGRHWLRRYR